MRCDVCDTKIMIGQKECPNCGMKIKDNYVNTFDASGKDHNHIKVEHKKDVKKTQTDTTQTIEDIKKAFTEIKNKIPNTPKKTTTSTKGNNNQAGIVKFIIVIVLINLIGSCVGVIGTVVGDLGDDIGVLFEELGSHYEPDYEHYYISLEDFEEEGYDFVDDLIDQRDVDIDIISSYVDEWSVEEEITTFDNVVCDIKVIGYKDDVEYRLETIYDYEYIDGRKLYIEWSSNDALVLYDEDVVEGITNDLGIQIDVSSLKKAYKQFLNENMTSSNDEFEMVINEDGYDVVMGYYNDGIDLICYTQFILN